MKAPDPPLKVVEAGCLQRAWSVFSARITTLTLAFGQLLPSTIQGPVDLWYALRQAKGSVANILRFLSEHHQISLLGDYRCLKSPA